MTGERKRARSRRSISAGRPRNYSNLYKRESGAESAQASSMIAVASATGGDINWAQEYAYVASDLRRLTGVSGVLLVLIVVAGFFF